MAKSKSTGGTIGLRNNKLIFALIGVLVIIVFVGALTLLRGIYQTETYYVLKEDVPTRTQIVPAMLTPVVASAGSAPEAAKGIADVQTGNVYSRFPLAAGDILTNSNVDTGLSDIANGVPDSWVITSFAVGADDAVGGRVHRGDYFDIMIAQADGSFYPFVNVLAIDTTVSLSSASSNNAANTQEAHDGQTSQYVVGMAPGDAARLHQLTKKYGGSFKLLLSPRQNQYAAPKLAEYSGFFAYQEDLSMMTTVSTPKDMGKDTDYTFAPVKRDAFGRPLEVTELDCSAGNGKVTDPALCGESAPQETQPAQDNATPSTTTEAPNPSASPSENE